MNVKTLWAAALCVALAPAGFAQTNDDFRNAVVEYLEVTHAQQTLVDVMLTAFRNVPAYGVLPGSYNERLVVEALNESYGDLIDIYVENWAAVVSLEDLKDVVAVMRSDSGKKLLKFQNSVLANSGPVMARYGAVVEARVRKKFGE